MEHAYQTYVKTSRVKVTVAEEPVGIHIVNPHSGTFEATLIAHLLYGASRYKELFEGTCIQLIETVSETDSFQTFVTGLFPVHKLTAETPHDTLHKRTD